MIAASEATITEWMQSIEEVLYRVAAQMAPIPVSTLPCPPPLHRFSVLVEVIWAVMFHYLCGCEGFYCENVVADVSDQESPARLPVSSLSCEPICSELNGFN